MKTIVWAEPERVTRGTQLWEEHPDWLLRTPEQESRGQRLLNLGNAAAVEWLVKRMDRLITQQGVDVYRTDFNIAPLQFWRDHDSPDRQGITEIKYSEILHSRIAWSHPIVRALYKSGSPDPCAWK
jgi:alpha-galactosidase